MKSLILVMSIFASSICFSSEGSGGGGPRFSGMLKINPFQTEEERGLESSFISASSESEPHLISVSVEDIFDVHTKDENVYSIEEFLLAYSDLNGVRLDNRRILLDANFAKNIIKGFTMKSLDYKNLEEVDEYSPKESYNSMYAQIDLH